MSEFRISRLRFSWVGEWVDQSAYKKDQIIQYEGKAYVCLVPHTSNGFYLDLDAVIPKWDLMMTGQTWKGPWQQFSFYSLDNIVIFGGIVYKCNTQHQGGAVLDTDIEKWDVYAESTTWQSEWTSVTTYGVGDIVQYGGSAYECVISHISADTDIAGLEADYVGLDSTEVKWKLTKEGVQWRGEYATASDDSSQVRYKLDDVIKYGPSVYKCIEGHAPSYSDPVDLGVYTSTAITNLTGNGSDFFKRELTAYGVRIVAAGAVGGQTAVPDAFIEKVAQTFKLLLNKSDAGINLTAQEAVINTLNGAAGTYHAGLPTLQRVARGAGADYSPNFLTDEGIASWNLAPLFDSHMANDMVWYLNSTGSGYGNGDIDAQEVIEHVFHTLHMYGLDATALKLYPQLSADWASGPLYLAMVEAYDAGMWDSAGYGGDSWKTNGDAFELAAKEYLYLLNFCMFEYTSLWEGGSLAPEWNDNVRDQAGILSNNPLGYALFNTYIAPVISKPSLATIRSIYGDGNTPSQDNPSLSGTSGYAVELSSSEVLEDSFISANWQLWMPGLDFDSVWTTNAIYQPGDIVLYGGYLYQSLTINNLNNKPSFNADDSTDAWEIVSKAYDVTGPWDTATEYKVGSVVNYGGDLYVALRDSNAQVPGNFVVDAIYEADGSTGTTIKLDTGDSTSSLAITVGMTVLGEGFASGQEVLTVSVSGSITTVTLNYAPDGAISDSAVLTFAGTNYVYWELLIPGFNWEGQWATGTLYNQDDIAYYSNATFKCLREHTSALVNRPDYDLQNNYWTVYLQHDQRNSLSSTGELIVRSVDDNAALSIGDQSQVLKVVGSGPVWRNTDFTPNLYYVATNGVDATDRGTTADTAWRTIKYACERVAEGTLKQNEKTLLEANKAWVIEETFYWFLYQQNQNLSPFDSSVNFDNEKTRRDARYIFDGIVTDLARGQNARTVASALLYFDLESTNKFANQTVADQVTFFTATVVQLFTNIENALTNTIPAQNYQTLEGVASPVAQYVNNALTIDADTITIVQSLENIIVTSLTNGSPDTIPPANQGAYTTISLKSGTYEEILPIVLPAKTALNGDELRGAVVKPADPVNTLCRRTIGDINQFVVGSTLNMYNNCPVQFVSLNPVDEISTVIGGDLIIQGITYYVIGSSITDTTFQVSATKDGAAVELFTNIGYMYVYGGNALGDMFRVQNGTGIRNMTLSGLLGTLTPQNEYETRRPSGGSFVSFDPGTGPEDTTAWITTKSPYVQNVTNFGLGCVGMKIDSTIHNGGNRSMVCNDFTQIISDGIGVWCTGGDALVEAVSVFSYYNYAGYFAEDGGRIRATNGNSSYGKYGVVAEGFDDSEIPATGNADNRNNQAAAIPVSALGASAEILKIQYSHAGEEYFTTTTNMLSQSNNFLATDWTTDANLNITKANSTPFAGQDAWKIQGITNLTNSSYLYQDIAVSPQGRVYTNIAGTNITGSGIDATFNVTVFADTYVVAVNAGGSGYVVGNEITISGQKFGAQPGANDITITVDALSITAISTVVHSGTVPLGSALPYVASIYAKKGSAQYFDMYATFSGYGADDLSSYVRFNFDTKTATTSQLANGGLIPTINSEFVTDGWYRVDFTFWDITAQNDALQIRLYPRGIDGIAGTTNFYGSQLQIGSDVTFFLETTEQTPTAYANIFVSGAGQNANVVANELRSDGIYQTRILDAVEGTTGGLGYKLQTNNAQSGNTEYLTLAGSEVATSVQYEDMRLTISSGKGAGQYGIISQYNEASKTASVLKESFEGLTILGAVSATDRFTLPASSDFYTVYEDQKIQFTPTYYNIDITSTSQSSVTATATLGDLNNTMTVGDTSALKVNQKINFTGTTFGGVQTGFDYFILNIVDGTTIQISTSLGGGVWPLNNADGTMVINYPANSSYLYGTSTSNMEIAFPIQYTGTSLGGVVLGTTYYIHDVYDANNFSISANKIDLTVTDTTVTSNVLTIDDTSVLIPMNSIIFKGATLGGLVEKTQYWIKNIIDGTTFTLASSVITTDATATAATSNLITVTSTAGFLAGAPIVFTGTTFGGITNDKVYYIQVVNDATTFTISETTSGAAVPLTTAAGLIVARTTANEVDVTTATGTMVGESIGEKLVITSDGGKVMGASFFTETFGGISDTTTYFVKEKFVTVPSDTYTAANNWTVAGTSWAGNNLSIDIDAAAGAAYIQALTTLGEDSSDAAFTVVDADLGSFTVTLTNGGWGSTPAAGSTINATTVQNAPESTLANIASFTFPTGADTIKEFTIAATSGGAVVQLLNETGSMQLGAVGWDHINPGTPLVNTFDSTSVYTIEPRIKFSSPNFAQTAMNNIEFVNRDYNIIASNGFYPIAIPETGFNALSTSNYQDWDISIILPETGDTEEQTADPDNEGQFISNPLFNGGWVDMVYGNNTWVLISRKGNVLYSVSEGATWLSATLPALATGENYTAITYGNNAFVAIATSSISAYSLNNGSTWTSVDQTIDDDDFIDIAYGGNTFVAISGSSHAAKYSIDSGATWTETDLDTEVDSTAGNWTQIKYGNGRFVAISSDEKSSAYSFDGVTWYKSSLNLKGTILEYGNGVFVALDVTGNNMYQSEDGFNWRQQAGETSAYSALGFTFDNTSKKGYFIAASTAGITHKISTGARAQAKVGVTASTIQTVGMFQTGSGYTTTPTVEIFDPNNSQDALLQLRTGDGVLSSPTFVNYGQGYSTTSTAITITGSGFADEFQTGLNVICKNLTRLPSPGDNLEFSGVDEVYRVAKSTVLRGSKVPNLVCSIQISPGVTEELSPAHDTALTVRSRFSQVRLTNHDFLNIGFGNQIQSNYPNLPTTTNLEPQDEVQETNNGRVFYSSTDQDGNFRVGDLFAVEQATGIVTLSADEFGLQGLDQLEIGGVALGGSPVTITAFSTDGTFVANSNNLVPTQKAIKTYLTSRLSQGGSDTFTGLLTAGTVKVGGPDEITSTVPQGAEGWQVEIGTKANISGPTAAWAGDGLAFAYFMKTLVDPTRSGQQ